MKIYYQTEDALKAAAAEMATTITPREGETRKTTKAEAATLYTIAYGALLAINFVGRADDAYSMVQGAKDAAEFIFDVSFPNSNGYDSLYCKIDAWIRIHRES